MTIQTNIIRNDISDGSNGIYPYTFKLFDEADIKVYVDGVLQTLTTDYTVTGVGSESGGNVIMNTSPGNVPVVLLAEVAFTQVTDLVNETGFYQDRIEESLDKITRMAQVLNERDTRALLLPEDEEGTALKTMLPPLDERKGRNLSFDPTTGQPVASTPSSAAVSAAMEPVVGSETLALARAAMGPWGDALVAIAGGTVERSLADRFANRVLASDFGVVGDGVTDNQANLQAAINKASALGVPLDMPVGVFYCNGPLTLKCVIRGVYAPPIISAVWGDAQWSLGTPSNIPPATIIQFGGIASGSYAVVPDGTSGGYAQQWGLENIHLSHKSTAGVGGGNCIRISDGSTTHFGTQSFRWRNVALTNWETGLALITQSGSWFYGTCYRGCKTAFQLGDSSGGGQATACFMDGVDISACGFASTPCIKLTNVYGSRICNMITQVTSWIELGTIGYGFTISGWWYESQQVGNGVGGDGTMVKSIASAAIGGLTVIGANCGSGLAGYWDLTASGTSGNITFMTTRLGLGASADWLRFGSGVDVQLFGLNDGLGAGADHKMQVGTGGNLISSNGGQVTANSGVPVTLFSGVSVAANYLLIVQDTGGGTNFAVAHVRGVFANAAVTTLSSSGITVSNSTTSVQATQSSGSTQTLVWSVLRLA